MVGRKVCFSEVALWIHGVSCIPSGVVHQRTIEEGITGWWCHLASIGIFGGLDLLWYGPCLGFDWLPPPDGGGVVVDMHRVGAERCLGRALRHALCSLLMFIS